MDSKLVDHLFRHQYGKMIAILTRMFGPANLELIEDAVQDTFYKAAAQWKINPPEKPEAWLMQAAKNRTIDLLRKVKSETIRNETITSGSTTITVNELFLDREIEDSQLRMIFLACHPSLSPEEQIAFALKSISGFSLQEIAAALLIKPETIKKRLTRARKSIIEKKLSFDIPGPEQLPTRLDGVLQIIYLIFNEGFHSTKKEQLISKELCGEAIRLSKLLLKREELRTRNSYSLFALMCLHAARLESKINQFNQIVDLKNQDRSTWYRPLIALGMDALRKADTLSGLSTFFIEAQIAAVHVNSKSFESTNWLQILSLYEELYQLSKSPYHMLNMAIIHLQLNNSENAKHLLDQIEPDQLEQRAYLYYGCMGDYYIQVGKKNKAKEALEMAISLTTNISEKTFLNEKLNSLKV